MKAYEIPKLRAEDVEVKIQKIFQNGISAVLYKTARTDMKYLDEVFGPGNWRDEFCDIKGNLYCTISVWDEEKEQWIGKSDCGTESRVDADGNEKKGEASDAFKRAGTKWGIGRELYTAPFLWIGAEVERSEKGNFALKDKRFRMDVSQIQYDDAGRICALEIVDQKGVVCYAFGAVSPAARPPAKGAAAFAAGSDIMVCCVCGKKLSRELYEGSISANGKPYCSGKCRDKDKAIDAALRMPEESP